MAAAFESAMKRGWVDLDDGNQATTSPEIIRQALLALRNERIFCVIRTRAYESGKLPLVGATAETLQFDRPPDWPRQTTLGPIRVLFKDKTQLWNQFSVNLLGVSDDTLTTTWPSKYVRIQRRSNYRVDTPRGSKAMFRHRGELEANFQVANVSANGVLLCCDHWGGGVDIGDPVSNISMSFPGEEGSVVQMMIKAGRVMRVCRNERRQHCFGINLDLTPQEEKELLRYVRQREREMLRRGLAEE